MIVLRLIGFLFDLLLLPLRLLRRGRHVPARAWLHVVIDGPVVDLVAKPRFWQVRAQKALSLHTLDAVVTAMLADVRVRGLLVTIKSMGAGMASASSLRGVLARARAGGKEVAVHLPMGGDTKEVFVASAASKVLVSPAAQLSPLGFRTASRYLKRALDRAGIEPQVFACGEFKSAGETLVRDSMSPGQRAQLERLLETFHGALVDAIAEGRALDRERASAIVDKAPYFGAEAVAAGLADHVAYEDEVCEKLGIEGGAPSLVDAHVYLARATRPLLRKVRRPPVLAVVAVHGAIAHAGGPLGGLSTDERLARTIRSVRRDRRVKGVLLHIDSPGGSALASDLMHHEIVQLAREKPVVACMANVAASGGYYVAAPAARIVAEATTVTGSIGVVAARLSVDPLLTRLGIVTEVVEKGAHAGLLSSTGALDDALRTTITRELDATYRTFVGVVAAGRKMPAEEVERLARGRVYTGRDALDAKLVDVIGGFDVALEELRKLLPAELRSRLEVKLAKTPRGPVSVPDLPEKKAARQVGAMLAQLLPAHERMVLELAWGNERVLALGPITET